MQNKAVENFEDFQAHFSALCNPYIHNQLRALCLWSPDFIAFASPLVTYALLGPAATHVHKSTNDAAAGQDALSSLGGEILSLVLQRFSDYWPSGSVVQSE